MPENESIEKSFEVMRHSDKDFETGELTELGRENACQRAIELFEEIKTYPEGTVIAFIPSNIDRTQQTRDIFEEVLAKLFNEEKKGFKVIDVKNTQEIKTINKETQEKILLTGLAQSTLLGFDKTEKNKSNIEFAQCVDEFDGDEDLIGKLWVATPEELETIKEEVKRRFPKVDLDEIKPSRFGKTPEDEAIRQVNWTMRMLEISRKHFPKNPVKIFGVSHNITTDYTIMKMLGLPINATTIENLGGTVRQYLEEHRIDFASGRVRISFRGQEKEFSETELSDIIRELYQESEIRKRMWKENNI